jgi:aspartate aminotransferase
MQTLSATLNRLAPSATLAMSQKSAELKAQGLDIISGKSHCSNPPVIIF